MLPKILSTMRPFCHIIPLGMHPSSNSKRLDFNFSCKYGERCLSTKGNVYIIHYTNKDISCDIEMWQTHHLSETEELTCGMSCSTYNIIHNRGRKFVEAGAYFSCICTSAEILTLIV